MHEIYKVKESERGRERQVEAACQLEYVKSSSVSKDRQIADNGMHMKRE